VNGVVPLTPRANAAYLKLDLLCRGARLHDSCRTEDDGGRPVLRTRAGLGSGLELVLPGGSYVNVPVAEAFARESPYELRRGPRGYALWRDGTPCRAVRLAPRPRWYDRRTSRGRAMRRVATLQGTVLAVYPGKVCDFWVVGPERTAPERCRFCSVGLNLGGDDAAGKTADEVMEVVHAARRESGITYVDLNAGHDDAGRTLDALEPLVRRIKRETGLLVGIQTPPHPDLAHFSALRALGLNRVSFCFELFDRERFRETCPGKARVYGLDGYLAAIEGCARLEAPPGLSREPWVVNGEIVAGLEPPQRSIEAVEWLTARGAIPTVCVFRPLAGTDLEGAPPPRTDDLVPVFRALYERCTERGLPIGVAHGVRVSLVLLPEECRALVQDPARLRSFRRAERARAWRGRAFRAWFAARRLRVPPLPRPSPGRIPRIGVRHPSAGFGAVTSGDAARGPGR
jgi:hypothetical protein